MTAVVYVIAEARQFALILRIGLEDILAPVAVAQGQLGVVGQALVEPCSRFVLLVRTDRITQIVAGRPGQVRLGK